MITNNAAGRLGTLLESAEHDRATNEVAVDVWARLFKITGSAPQDRDAEVAHSLGLARRQLLQVRERLTEWHTDPRNYRALDAAEQALSMRFLGSPWNVVKPHLDGKAAGILLALAPFLGGDEPRLTDDALQAAHVLVEQLRETVNGSDLTPAVKHLLFRQLDLVDRALRDYEIQGAAAFREASDDAANLWLDQSETIAPVLTHPIVHEISALWAKLQQAVSDAELRGRFFRTAFGVTIGAALAAQSTGRLPPDFEPAVQAIVNAGLMYGTFKQLSSGAPPKE